VQQVQLSLPNGAHRAGALGAPDAELYLNDWILLQLEGVHRRRALYLAEGQSRAVDFAIRSLSMGHCVVVSYDPELRKIYYRHDGGSNGYDRADHRQFALAYVPVDSACADIDHWCENQPYTLVTS
jgi:hypothetical protein